MEDIFPLLNINSETNDESTVKDFLFNDFIFPIEGNDDYNNNGLYESPNFAILKDLLNKHF